MSETKPGALNRLWSSKTSAIAAVLVIALVALSIGALIVWNTIDNTKDAQAGAEGSIAATAPASAATSAAATGECDVPAGDQSLYPALPTDLEWKASNGVTWPASATAGPTKYNAEGFGICFAKSPLGAALMTTTFIGAGSGVDVLAATELYLADSPGKTESLAQTTPGPANETGLGAPTGFIIKDFDAAAGTATVATVVPMANSDTGYLSIAMDLQWMDGDWKISWPVGGLSAAAFDKPVAGQFTSWKGTP